MVDLIDIAKRVVDEHRIKHGTPDIIDLGEGTGRRTKIENPHLSTLGNERGYEVLTDEAGAARDKYSGHECGSGPT
jgi:hypothetical protein